MEVHQLRYFLAVAAKRHFSKAANDVHITQPTLTQQIQKLEKELGAPLFERAPKNIRLTEAGERFLVHARKIIDALDGAKDDILSIKGQIVGRVRLAAIPTIGPYLLPAVLKKIKKRAPKLQLELHELTTSTLLSQLKDGKVDLGVLALPIKEPGMLTRPLYDEPFYLAVPKSHPLAKMKSVTIKDIRDEKILILQEGHCFREQSLEYCRISPENPQVIFQGSSLTSVLRLTAAGEGITFAPQMAAIPKENPGVQFIPFTKPPPSRQVGIVWRQSSRLTGGQNLLIDLIEEALHALSDTKNL